MRHTLLYILTFILAAIPSAAQENGQKEYESGIRIKNVKVLRNGTNIDISCVFDVRDIKVRSNKSITYIPYITRGGRLRI